MAEEFEFIPDYDGLKEMLQLPEITDRLAEVAGEVLQRAQQAADAQGLTEFSQSMRVVSGTRPKGRTESEVIGDGVGVLADSPDAESIEYGDSNTPRYRILGTAAGVTIFPN